MSYTTIEAAKKLGITKDTLLYYEKEGLLPFIKRDNLNRRAFSDSDLDWIFLILCLRDTDMPICKIKQYISLIKSGEGDTMKDRKIILEEHAAYIEEKIVTFQNLQQLIGKKISYYDESISSEDQSNITCLDYAEEWQHFRTIPGGIKND